MDLVEFTFLIAKMGKFKKKTINNHYKKIIK